MRFGVSSACLFSATLNERLQNIKTLEQTYSPCLDQRGPKQSNIIQLVLLVVHMPIFRLIRAGRVDRALRYPVDFLLLGPFLAIHFDISQGFQMRENTRAL